MAFIVKIMHENLDIALPTVPLLLIIFTNILPILSRAPLIVNDFTFFV